MGEGGGAGIGFWACQCMGLSVHGGWAFLPGESVGEAKCLARLKREGSLVVGEMVAGWGAVESQSHDTVDVQFGRS